jgi:hypothetical protein
MKFLTKYSSVKDFLYRFTILKIGKLHIRIHKIVSPDKTTLLHSHPFHYCSIILKGGYVERVADSVTLKTMESTHKAGSVIIRDNSTPHRIEMLLGETWTLFVAWGDYGWKAYNLQKSNVEDGLFRRKINEKIVWSKRKDGVWYIGNEDQNVAMNETRFSIHQTIDKF